MKDHEVRDGAERVLAAETLSGMAERLAARRDLSLAGHEEPDVAFEDLRLPVASRPRRRRMPWALGLSLGAAAAAVLVVAVRPPAPTQRDKGGGATSVSLEVRSAPPDGALEVRVVGTTGPARLFDVHLGTGATRELGPAIVPGPDGALRATAWAGAAPGRHAVLVVAGAVGRSIERADVVALLHALADGAETRLAGAPVSAAVVEVRVP